MKFQIGDSVKYNNGKELLPGTIFHFNHSHTHYSIFIHKQKQKIILGSDGLPKTIHSRIVLTEKVIKANKFSIYM